MKPLDGVTVIEFSTMITASFAAMMMAEQGARVIKVEPLESGDPMRYMGVENAGISSLFANCNRGKQSIRVNIKSDAGQSLIREMISEVDVLIHNFRPGVMDRLNLGSDALRAINPKLIYSAISGFGTKGGLANAPAYDPIIQAYTGLTAIQGKGSQPAFFHTLISDKVTAYTACQAIISALFHRERTGEGQHIDVSMLDASLFFAFPDGFQNHTLLDDGIASQPLTADLVFRLLPTKNGGVAFAPGTPEMLTRSLTAVGVQHLLQDERFNSNEKRANNFEEFFSLIEEAYLQYTMDEAIERLKEADIPCARCLSRDEVLAHDQLAENDTIGTIDHPLMGKMRVVKFPARFSGERLALSRPSPDHGENTKEVLNAFAIGEQRIQTLMDSGVVR